MHHQAAGLPGQLFLCEWGAVPDDLLYLSGDLWYTMGAGQPEVQIH
jgi:hypothetical protein